MSYEINESRTPPTVMLSLTPTYEKEFNYPLEPPVVLSAERFKDVSNLKVNQRRSRSFTPVKGSLYMRSPELSPIGVSNKGQNTPEPNASGDSGTDLLTPGEFKIPKPKTIKGTTPTGPPHTPQYHSQNANKFGTPTANSSEDPNRTQNLDKSASHGYLNHKLDVRLILKNASMQQYIKAFNKENIDFEKFLTLCDEDLLRLGVKRKVDRKVISSLINDLNAN